MRMRSRPLNKSNYQYFIDVYVATFKEYERISIDALNKNIQHKKNSVFVIEVDGEKVGFYILYHGNAGFDLLWYIGIAPDKQGNGFGEYAIRNIQSERALVVEAAERQSKWYNSLGFHLLTPDYCYPSFTNGSMVSSDLLAMLTEGQKAFANKEWIVSVVIEILENVYSVDVKDERYLEIVSKLKDP